MNIYVTALQIIIIIANAIRGLNDSPSGLVGVHLYDAIDAWTDGYSDALYWDIAETTSGFGFESESHYVHVTIDPSTNIITSARVCEVD